MADSKITGLTEDTAPAATDLLLTVDDPGGSPANKKATIANVGKAVNSSAASYASRAAAGVEGKLYLPTDSFYLQRDTGAAYTAWGPIFPMTVPVAADFAWINQEGATVDTTYGSLYLEAPASAGTDMRILKKAKSAPYVITACFIPNWFSVDYSTMGLVFRQSSDGKLVVLRIYVDAGTPGVVKLNVDKFTNATTYSAGYITSISDPMFAASPMWLRIEDNSTNRICSYSRDGRHFQAVHTVGRTDYLTADEVGFFVESGQATYAAGINLLSWQEA